MIGTTRASTAILAPVGGGAEGLQAHAVVFLVRIPSLAVAAPTSVSVCVYISYPNFQRS